MPDNKRSFILSFCIGGLIGGGVTLLLSQYFLKMQKTRSGREKTMRRLRGELKEQPYENGIYCAPEGADIHYDMGEEDIYYSKDE